MKSKNLLDEIRKFNLIIKYNPKEGGQLCEGYWNPIDKKYHDDNNPPQELIDYYAKNWTLIGEIKNSNIQYVTGDYYLFVNNYYREPYLSKGKYDSWYDNALKLNDRPDFVGRQSDWYSGLKKFVVLLPEYEEKYGEALANKNAEDISKEFLSQIKQSGGDAILRHRSSVKIVNGVLDPKAKQNSYSNNSGGIYFWGNDKTGQDPSNMMARYEYYCKYPLNKIYDMENDIEGYGLPRNVDREKYPVLAHYWVGYDDSIVANSVIPMPISYIKHGNKFYDAEWNEINA